MPPPTGYAATAKMMVDRALWQRLASNVSGNIHRGGRSQFAVKIPKWFCLTLTSPLGTEIRAPHPHLSLCLGPLAHNHSLLRTLCPHVVTYRHALWLMQRAAVPMTDKPPPPPPPPPALLSLPLSLPQDSPNHARCQGGQTAAPKASA